jgi:branched-chain amino acid transport system permease protein
MDLSILPQTIAQGVLVGSTYGLIGLSMGLMYSVSGAISLAQGHMVSMSMYLVLSLYTGLQLDPYVSVAITLPVLALAGAALYWFLIRPLSGNAIMVFQASLGLMFLIENVLLMIYGGQFHQVPSIVSNRFLVFGDAMIVKLPLLIGFGVTGALAGILFVTLEYSDYGRSMRAVHQNERSAALVGVNVQKVRLWVFAMSGAVIAIAGVLLVPSTPLHPAEGLKYTLVGLMPLVLAGMSNFFGILLSGVIIGLAEAIGTVYISGAIGLSLPYIIFILILIFRPHGLFKGH